MAAVSSSKTLEMNAMTWPPRPKEIEKAQNALFHFLLSPKASKYIAGDITDLNDLLKPLDSDERVLLFSKIIIESWDADDLNPIVENVFFNGALEREKFVEKVSEDVFAHVADLARVGLAYPAPSSEKIEKVISCFKAYLAQEEIAAKVKLAIEEMEPEEHEKFYSELIKIAGSELPEDVAAVFFHPKCNRKLLIQNFFKIKGNIMSPISSPRTYLQQDSFVLPMTQLRVEKNREKLFEFITSHHEFCEQLSKLNDERQVALFEDLIRNATDLDGEVADFFFNPYVDRTALVKECVGKLLI